ncbi:MAG: diaminopimelate decarboxylase [Micavibrio aeruginosavorus]|uniref:Diaminopimelate decarboxylase n=1 Tax=Micavibrio aeruginosavorus TaxID=349221 RepID=A0A2W5N110_9BACT|nr:MAG: diaminopimelate decarboxylase [Micavibrio aeruginosavorus]
MSGFEEKDGVLHADGVSLQTIAKQVGTPAYVYSASVIESQFAKLKGAMEKAIPANRQPLLCFACKANSNLAVLNFLQSLGSGLEIVSEGELVRALKAGFDPKKIVSTGVGKSRSEIAACLKAGILQFNVESIPELERIQEVAQDIDLIARVAFRLNPDIGGGGHEKITTGRKTDKFGIVSEMMETAYTMAEKFSHIDPVGLHMHIGAQVFQVERFKDAFEKLRDVVLSLRKNGHSITRLDIGGGFPIVYKDEQLLDLDYYAKWVNEIIVPLDVEIVMEPGRFLVGNAGVLLTEVLFVKETPAKNFLIVDSAMNDLIRPALYDSYHAIEPIASGNAKWTKYDVVGPVCESGDTFTKDREMPEMKQGDFAVIRSAGAYGASMASNYNTRPMAAEVMTKNGKFEVIRPRQTYEDIIGRDIIPDWTA